MYVSSRRRPRQIQYLRSSESRPMRKLPGRLWPRRRSGAKRLMVSVCDVHSSRRPASWRRRDAEPQRYTGGFSSAPVYQAGVCTQVSPRLFNKGNCAVDTSCTWARVGRPQAAGPRARMEVGGHFSIHVRCRRLLRSGRVVAYILPGGLLDALGKVRGGHGQYAA